MKQNKIFTVKKHFFLKLSLINYQYTVIKQMVRQDALWLDLHKKKNIKSNIQSSWTNKLGQQRMYCTAYTIFLQGTCNLEGNPEWAAYPHFASSDSHWIYNDLSTSWSLPCHEINLHRTLKKRMVSKLSLFSCHHCFIA